MHKDGMEDDSYRLKNCKKEYAIAFAVLEGNENENRNNTDNEKY